MIKEHEYDTVYKLAIELRDMAKWCVGNYKRTGFQKKEKMIQIENKCREIIATINEMEVRW